MKSEVVSKIGLGTVQFGLDYGIGNKKGITPKEEVSKILSYCKQKGVSVIDTAFAYGISEEILGENNLEGFNVISKFLPEDITIPPVLEQLEISMKRLHVTSLYGYLAHRPMSLSENKGIWEQLQEIKEKGIVKKIGFSCNTPEEIDILESKNIIPDIVQVPFNYFDNRFERNIIRLKEEYNTEIHVRSIFLQGLFFSDVRKLSSFFDPVKDIIRGLQVSYSPLSSYLIKFVTCKPYIDRIIIGVNNKVQLKDNIELKVMGDLPMLTRDINHSILIPSKWPK